MSITKEVLAKEIAKVLELPILGRKGQAYKIITIILQAIEHALELGEDVKVNGFGIFRIRTRKPTRKGAYFYPYLRQKGLHTEVLNLPAKRYVHFQPSKVLLRMLNHA